MVSLPELSVRPDVLEADSEGCGDFPVNRGRARKKAASDKIRHKSRTGPFEDFFLRTRLFGDISFLMGCVFFIKSKQHLLLYAAFF